jgi:hypothetical protein
MFQTCSPLPKVSSDPLVIRIGFRLVGRRTLVHTIASASDSGMPRLSGSHFLVMEAASISLGGIDVVGDMAVHIS